MPELPDVEGMRQTVEQRALRRRVAHTAVVTTRVLAGVSAAALQRRTRGHVFVATARHGKHLFVQQDDEGWLTMHFGLTGGLVPYAVGDEPPKHTRVAFEFEDGGALAFTNRRMLGRIGVADAPARYIEAHGLGPDALQLPRQVFLNALAGRSGAVKPVLTDQSMLAGIGNEYADEILFQAGIHPGTRVVALDDDARRRLHRVLARVLRVAARRGGRVDELPDGYLQKVRGRRMPCPGCGGPLEQTVVGGRTTYFCPRRQPPP